MIHHRGKVCSHCHTGSGGISLAQCSKNRIMLLDYRSHIGSTGFVMEERAFGRRRADAPKFFNRHLYRRITRRLGNYEMERSVSIFCCVKRGVFDLFNKFLKFSQFVVTDVYGSKSRGLSFKNHACLSQLEGCYRKLRTIVAVSGQPAHKRSGTYANFNETLNFQCDQRLSDGGTAHVMFYRKLPFGGESIADFVASGGHLVDQHPSQPLIQPFAICR